MPIHELQSLGLGISIEMIHITDAHFQCMEVVNAAAAPLCCRRLNGAKTENCSPEVFKPESLGIFQTALMYFLRISLPTVQPDMMYIFWGHEWSK